MSSLLPSNAASTGKYSKEEVADIYALGRMWLETGQFRRAEVIMHGLNTVAPDFAPAWLGTALVMATLGNLDVAHDASRRALKLQPQSAEAMMFVVLTALSVKDANTAGTYLGEVGDMIDQGKATDPNLIRLYKMQLARYQGRGK